MTSILFFLEQWLAKAARRTIARERPLIIAITGTVGKSSTKQAIGALLHAQEIGSRTRVSAKNYNNELGVPLTVFGMSAPGRSIVAWLRLLSRAFVISFGWQSTGVRTFVLEMGADQPGDLAHLVSIAPPNISVITAVTPDDPSVAPVHLEHYPSIDAVAEEKSTLVRAVAPGGTIILNADDMRVFAMRHLTQAHALTYGETDAADVRLVSSHVVMRVGDHGMIPSGLEMEINCFNRVQKVFIPGIFGRSIAYAVCAALAVAEAMDIHLDAAQHLTRYFEPLPGRTRIIPGIKDTTLLDDSYNASPAAVLSAIHDLEQMSLQESQRRIVCVGEMRELGPKSRDAHRMIGAEVAKQRIDLLVACGTLAPAMQEGALANGMREDQIKIFDDTLEAIPFLHDWIKPGDLLLAKASEGPLPSSAQWNKVPGIRMERIIKALMAEPLRAQELLCRQEGGWKR